MVGQLFTTRTRVVSDGVFCLDRRDTPDIKALTSVNFRALPPVVVSGLPNITPIFATDLVMNTMQVLPLLSEPVSFRSACDMRRL